MSLTDPTSGDDELLARYLDGRALLPGDAERLQAVLTDAATATRIKELLLVDNLLARSLAPERADFVNRMRSRLERAGESARFVSRVGEAAQRQTWRTRGRWLAWAAGAALAAGLMLIFFLPVTGVGVVESGSGRYWRAAVERPLTTGANLIAGDRVIAENTLRLHLNDGSSLTLDTDSELTLAPTAEVAAALVRGRVSAQVAKRPAGATWRLRTPYADVAVVGTMFTCALDAQGARVAVGEGVVNVETPHAAGSAHESLRLVAGEVVLAAPTGGLQRLPADLPSAGLLGWWSFDEELAGGIITVADRSGNGRDGRAEHCYSVPGIAGRGVAFKGRALIDAGLAGLGEPAEFTISLWLRTSSPHYGMLFSEVCTIGHGAGHPLHPGPPGDPAAAGRLSAAAPRSSGEQEAWLHSDRRVNDGTWHHACWWYREGVWRIWIDGQPQGEQRLPAVTPFDWANWRFCIGAGTEQMVYNFDGELDEVRVYGRALVDGEIKALAHPSGRE